MEQSSAGLVHSKRQTLRANPSQTAVLQEAYARSSSVNTEIATELHHKTGLPPKWITQWFARRRSKERKRATGTLGPTSQSLLASSSDAGYSPSDAFQVKMEDRDNILPSRSSSSVTPFGTTESPQFFGGSGSGLQYVPDNESTSSAIVSRGRKRKQTNAYQEVPAPRKRGRKKNDRSVPLQLTQIKQEHAEIPGSTGNRERTPAEHSTPAHLGTLYADSAVENTVLTDSGGVAGHLVDHFQARGTMLHHTGFQIAPPKRSSKAPLRQKSNVSANNPAAATSFSRARNTFSSTDAMIEYQSGDRPGIFVDATPPPSAPFSLLHQGIYQRAPIFRMGFQNSGPDNFAVNSETTQRGRSGAPVSPVSSTSEMRTNLNAPVLDMPFALQSASDRVPFPNDDTSDGSYAGFYDMRSIQTTNLQAWPSVFNGNDEGAQFDISAASFESSEHCLFPAADAFQSQDMMAIMDAYHSLPSLGDGFDHDTYDDVLDPSCAPLKHLVDVLQDFKDENGGFSRLRCPDEHPVLIQRLTNQNLLEQNYFQAAMGHVLLIRLGLQAE